MAQLALALRGIAKTFPASPTPVVALDGVDLVADEREFVSIVGPSGCGKSTLFNIVAGLEAPNRGEVWIDGQRAEQRPGLVGYMPQKDLLFPWLTVLDNTILGLQLQGVSTVAARTEALELFERFGLSGFERQYPSALSGGMRQRAAFLRTVLCRRRMLLLDEPFGALDALTRQDMQEWLLTLWDELRPTVLFITHDIDEALFLSDRVYVLSPRPGRVILEVAVPLPRPRTYRLLAQPEFGRLKGQLLDALKGGVAVHQSELMAGPVGAERVANPAPARWRPLAEFGLAALLLLALLFAWQAAVWAWQVPKWLLPAPWDILTTLITDRELIATHVGRTIQEALVGFGIAFVLGVALAFAMDTWPTARRVLYPPLIGSQTVPIIIVAPLLVIWFGYDLAPKVAVVALFCFFPIVVSTIDGLSGVDPDYANLVRAMGGSEREVFRRVRLPGALPAIFSGAKIAVTYSVIGAVVGEWVGASRGIGIYMVRAVDQMLTERVFAAIVLSSLLSITFFLIVVGIERLALPWHRPPRRRADRRR